MNRIVDFSLDDSTPVSHDQECSENHELDTSAV